MRPSRSGGQDGCIKRNKTSMDLINRTRGIILAHQKGGPRVIVGRRCIPGLSINCILSRYIPIPGIPVKRVRVDLHRELRIPEPGQGEPHRNL